MGNLVRRRVFAMALGACLTAVGGSVAAQGQAPRRTAAPMRGFGGADPTVSHVLTLLMWPEVQSEIHLDLRQKQQMLDAQQEYRTQMMEIAKQSTAAIRALSPQERRAHLAEIGRMRRAEQLQLREAENQKLLDSLRPDQLKRLHELDLQYRGPFALLDKSVAEAVKLSAPHRDAIEALYTELSAKIQEAMARFYQEQAKNAPPPPPPPGLPQNPPGAPVPGGLPNGLGLPEAPPEPTAAQRAARESYIRFRKTMEAAYREAEEKAVGLLSADERAAWKSSLGEPFTFRQDRPSRLGAAGI